MTVKFELYDYRYLKSICQNAFFKQKHLLQLKINQFELKFLCV